MHWIFFQFSCLISNKKDTNQLFTKVELFLDMSLNIKQTYRDTTANMSGKNNFVNYDTNDIIISYIEIRRISIPFQTILNKSSFNSFTVDMKWIITNIDLTNFTGSLILLYQYIANNAMHFRNTSPNYYIVLYKPLQNIIQPSHLPLHWNNSVKAKQLHYCTLWEWLLISATKTGLLEMSWFRVKYLFAIGIQDIRRTSRIAE